MTEIELFYNAVSFAANKHNNQTRKDGITPYIYHPFKVAELVRDAGGNIKYQTVAILHDILEDTDATEDEIRKFGDDVLEAVKLLTRQKNMDESEYVEAILNNHIAATVKAADKIHNIYEAAYCDDKKWAKKYIKKSMHYYYGKFSKALDNAIGNAEGILCIYKPTKRPLHYSDADMMLYSDKEAIIYNEQKDLYDRCINRPNFNNPNMQYWYNNIGYYFCFTDNNNVWKLGRAGWMPRYGNPIQESEYGDDLGQVNRDDIKQFIEKKKNEGNYFYDFVDISIL